jgi:putative serine protease PepD
VVAALVALVVGGGAGYVGARVGQQQNAGPDLRGGSGPAPAGQPTSGTVPAASAGASASAGSVSTGSGPVAPARTSADTVKIAAKVLPSTVTIRVTAAGGGGLGSGFVLDDQGRIMTNNHVVADADGTGSIRVTFADGHRAKATLLGRSPGYDLAVIQVDDRHGLRPVTLGHSGSTRVGEPAVAIGSPLGLTGTVTEGIISAVNRPVAVGDADSPDGPAYLNALQTDAPINRGNSGGPLVNGSGDVIGINSAILTGSDRARDDGNIGIGFAIPIDQAREIGRLLIEHGHASYPVINATVTTDSGTDAVVLSTVTPGGAADRAGLRADDVVTAIDGRPVAEAEDLIVAIRNHRPGDTVTLQYRRDGRTGSVPVKLAAQRG